MNLEVLENQILDVFVISLTMVGMWVLGVVLADAREYEYKHSIKEYTILTLLLLPPTLISGVSFIILYDLTGDVTALGVDILLVLIAFSGSVICGYLHHARQILRNHASERKISTFFEELSSDDDIEGGDNR